MLFPFLKPEIPQPSDWVGFLDVCYEARYFSNFGPLSSRLEGGLAETYFASDYDALLCASNTLGLQVALSACLPPGSKVAMPAFTFAATFHAALGAGMVPVLCDIDPTTWELGIGSLEAALAEHPDLAAVIHVRPFGLLRDIGETRRFCAEHGLRLILDAAAGLGAPNPDSRFGSDLEEIEVFSLHATKVFAIGEGGVIAAPKSLMPRLKSAANFGFRPDRTFADGTNAKIDEFRAAIGLAMLPRMPGIIAGRRAHAQMYSDVIAKFPTLRCAADPGGTAWSTFPVLLSRSVDTEVLGLFADRGIEVKRYYWPSLCQGYKGARPFFRMPTPVSQDVANRIICLPVYNRIEPGMKAMLVQRLELCLGDLFS